MISWNVLGILLWVALILYFIFIIQHIRKRRIKMIIEKHQRFSWSNFWLNIVEVVIFLAALAFMFNKTMLDNPELENNAELTASVEYEPLVMKTGTGNSSYVTQSVRKKKIASQTYTYYRSGSKSIVSSDFATIAYGKDPLDINAERIPYDKKKLREMDRKYQKAYVAVYTAWYKQDWKNGIGMHAGHVAMRYYLIRVPDASFIKQK